MNVHKTKIEWCSHTWNPVTGCEYCYAQRIVSRFEPKIDEWPDEAITTAPSADGGPELYVVERPTRLKTKERGNGSEGYEKKVEWVIIGAMTGPGSAKKQPKREWIQAIVDDASITGVPVFMKDSLKAVCGDDLIREYPSGMDGGLNG